MIEALCKSGKMSESEARNYLTHQRREASKVTRSDARIGVFASVVGLLVCAGLLYYQYEIGRFSIKLVALLVAAAAFCVGAFVRNFRNLNSR